MESLALMPKYEDYVDSGVEWLGDIPASWSLLANKHIFRLKKKQVGKRSNEYDLLSLTLRGVIKRDMENPEGKFPAEFDTYQEVQCGDFIFCLFDVEETPRTVGLSPFNGMITGAYTVFEPNDNFDNRFLYYFYLNLDAKKRLKPLYRGLRNTIPKDSFLSFKTFVPPHEQQTRIANFLDQKTAQIDEAIAIKEQQISLLKERKQIIIQQAVTQGLDPNVPMKDSGVDWIGKIPAHWEVKQSRFLFRVVRRSDRRGDEIKYSVTQARGLVPTDEMTENSTQAESFDSFQLCHQGDLVLNKYKAHLGVFWKAPDRGIITNNYTVFSPLSNVSSKYFELLFHTPVYVSIFRTLVYGVTEGMSPLYTNDFYNMRSIVPPFDEQLQIESYVADVENRYSEAFSSLQNQVSSFKEYKTTLINSAVTGKIKITPEMVEQ
ncbi:restriction endonuclease subunit S [Vibrio cholerae]